MQKKLSDKEKLFKELDQRRDSEVKLMKKDKLNREWHDIRSMLGNDWAIFYAMLGGREAGKSYAVTKFFVHQYLEFGRPFYWMRLTDRAASLLLQDNAKQLIDPDIRRHFGLDLVTKGQDVYQVLSRTKDGKVKRKKFMAKVMCLSTFYNDKGQGIYDKDFLNNPKMYYNIAMDEFEREKYEKNNFNILYAFAMQLENLVRSTKQRIRVFLIGNTLEEASDILCCFNFLPEKFGRYYLKSKRLIIDYMEPTEKYKERRKGSIGDILMGESSNYTNKMKVDDSIIFKGKLKSPDFVIKFTKDTMDWFTLWDSKIVTDYKNENKPVISMQPYLDEIFVAKSRDNIIQMFDARAMQFQNLITFKRFQKNLEMLRPRR